MMGNISSSTTKVWHDSREAWGQVLDKMRARDVVEWLVADELRGQCVLTALAKDLDMEGAKAKFKHVFLARENPYSITSPAFVESVDASIVLDKGNGAHSSN